LPGLDPCPEFGSMNIARRPSPCSATTATASIGPGGPNPNAPLTQQPQSGGGPG
jgi:hypothetical protein